MQEKVNLCRLDILYRTNGSLFLVFGGGGGWGECHLKDNINTKQNYIEKCKNINLNSFEKPYIWNGGRGKGVEGKVART